MKKYVTIKKKTMIDMIAFNSMMGLRDKDGTLMAELDSFSHCGGDWFAYRLCTRSPLTPEQMKKIVGFVCCKEGGEFKCD